MDTPLNSTDQYAENYKDKIPSDVFQEPNIPTPLTQTTFEEAEAYFELFDVNAIAYTLINFGGHNECIMPSKDAEAVSQLIARGIANKQRSFSYLTTPKYSAPTMRVLTPYEYKCQWLANYFNVTVEEIQRYCFNSPMSEAKRLHAARKLDFTPPQLDLPLELDSRVADATDTEYR